MELVRFGHFSPLREADGPAAVDERARTARVVIITEGLGNLRDRNYYARSAVESCAEVFNGKQFYLDHPSKVDEDSRPERSVRDLAGYFMNATVGTIPDPRTGQELSACFATLKFAESEPGRLAFDQVRTALEYQRDFPNVKDVFCGISINGGGVSHQDRIDGLPVNMVTEIKEAFSADIVTKPARGGKFIALTESEIQGYLRSSGEPAEGEIMKVSEARRKAITEEAKRRMLTVDGPATISDKIVKLVSAINEPPEDPDDLIMDIQADVDALSALLDDLRGVKKAEAARRAAEKEKSMTDAEKQVAAEAEAKRKAAEAEAEAKKTAEAEAAKKASEDEARKAAEALLDDEDDEDEPKPGEEPGEEPEPGADKGQYGMKYACEACTHENEVLPPKGYRLTKQDEAYATESQKGLAKLIVRLRRALETKEARFMEANKEKRDLMQEVITLRAKVQAYERVTEARKQLREAGIPKDILSPMELITFEPDQWAVQIKSAKRALESERKLLSTGGNPGQGGDNGKDKPTDAASAFRESYKASR